jgi:hypothetical protein
MWCTSNHLLWSHDNFFGFLEDLFHWPFSIKDISKIMTFGHLMVIILLTFWATLLFRLVLLAYPSSFLESGWYLFYLHKFFYHYWLLHQLSAFWIDHPLVTHRSSSEWSFFKHWDRVNFHKRRNQIRSPMVQSTRTEGSDQISAKCYTMKFDWWELTWLTTSRHQERKNRDTSNLISAQSSNHCLHSEHNKHSDKLISR